MRKELKLAFDELEKELLVIPPDDLFRFMGGFSTGSSSSGSSGLSADASIDEVVDYLKDTGMSFTQDSSGNYYFNPTDSSGTSIRLDEVVVTGFYSTGSSGSWDTGGTGASGFNSNLDMYIAYLGGYGHQFSGGNGSYTYIPSGSSGGTTTNPSTGGSQPGDPFKRENGQLVITSTGKTTDIDYIYVDDPFDDVILNFEEVNIKDKNGNDVLAYRVVSYQTDADGPKYTDIPDKYKRNCHGSALGVDLWFNDIYDPNLRDVNVQEDQGFRTMMNGYTSNSSDSNVISFYTGSLLTHSVKRDPSTGEIWSKTDHGETKHYVSLDAFFADGNNQTLYAQSMRKYYKL
ncbi:hypothetical protein [uncultured Sphingobacterium sp.]|uniref:hypothetical protein n=1 Tax=uncultured Sphingobacterium sp. TaxID=182688 RepID=UPI0025DE5C38|nr:hypothetical protein [uncultured Sphingobacterium sp.]